VIRVAKQHQSNRSGAVLVIFAMIAFGLFAMAALVIDIGFARLTQRQMQVAADTAAIEGLRGEGLVGYDARRQNARQMIEWQFDDDLDTSTVDVQYGAGPLLSFTGTVGEPSLAAGQLLDVDSTSPVYKPAVLDGTPSGPGEFQVALRRGPTDVPAADLYCNGPVVPYLFARGSLISRQHILDGITVRATGETGSPRAISVGFADSAYSLPGLLPIALDLGYWNGLTTGVTDTQVVTAGDVNSVGVTFTPDTTDVVSMPLTVGRAVPAPAVVPDDSYTGYVPLYADISGVARVVGYGHATVTLTSTTATVERFQEHVGEENVSAVFCYPLPPALSSADLNTVLATNWGVAEPLLAVRSTQ